MRASKGSAWEREFCRRLSLWWTDGKRDDVFWRTSNSGGRATSRGKMGKQTANQHGDVCAVDPVGKPFTHLFTPELKRGYNHSTIADLLDKGPRAAEQTYEKWIGRAEASSVAAQTWSWLLVVKRDQREPVVFMPIFSWRDLGLGDKFDIGTLSPGIIIYSDACEENVCGLTLKQFFKLVKPGKVLDLLERLEKELT